MTLTARRTARVYWIRGFLSAAYFITCALANAYENNVIILHFY